MEWSVVDYTNTEYVIDYGSYVVTFLFASLSRMSAVPVVIGTSVFYIF